MTAPRTAPLRWFALPGLAMPPGDYQAVAEFAGVPIRALDQRETALTAPTPVLWQALGMSDDEAPVGLIGHSVGGVSAVKLAMECARRQPGRLRALVLCEASAPRGGKTPVWMTSGSLERLACRLLGPGGLPQPLLAAVPPVVEASMRVTMALDRSQVPRALALARRREFTRWCLGTREGLIRQWEDLRGSWAYERSLAADLAALDGTLAEHLGFRPVYVAGLRASRRWMAEQRDFGQRLGATFLPAWNTGHLIPLSNPGILAKAMARAVREAAGPA